MSKAVERKMLFCVEEVTFDDGSKHMEVEWHPELYPTLDAATPEGKYTDQLIAIAEELTETDDDEENQ